MYLTKIEVYASYSIELYASPLQKKKSQGQNSRVNVINGEIQIDL